MFVFGVPLWLAATILVPLIGFGISLIFLILLSIKTPAWTFLKASLGKRNIIINPRENGYISFVAGKPYSMLSYVKGEGFYLTNPSDRYIEAKSKVPCFINYGRFAFSVSPQFALIAKKLREMGIKNWEQLKKAYKNELKGKFFMLESQPISWDWIYREIESAGIKDWSKPFRILGESVSFDHVVDYFGRNERTDLIEAEIARREAAATMQKLKSPENIFKWAVILAIIIIAAAIGYFIIQAGAPQAVSQAIGSTAKVVSGGVSQVKQATGTVVK